MNTIFLGLIALALVAAALFFILIVVELKGTAKELRELIRTTERSVKPTLIELQETLRSVRDFTDNINEVAEDVRRFSASLREVGEHLRVIGDQVKEVSEVVSTVGRLTKAEVFGMRAGFTQGVRTLLGNLMKKRNAAEKTV
ncbi:MAG: DUF948 domain-containing protein [Desulfobacterota bacterium]|nr:DUF948 domain-containing protein [Thermodesulfobacteriota bacterium]